MAESNSVNELKEYIRETIGLQISQIASAVNEQGRLLHNIEITTTTDIATVKKDINNIYSLLEDIEQEQNRLKESHKMNFRTLADQRAKEKEEQAKKDEQQARINESFSTMKYFLYAILTTCIGILLTFIWQVIVNGGVKFLNAG